MARNLANLIFKIVGDTSKFDEAMRKTENKLRRTGSRMQSIGSRLTTGLTVPLAAMGGGALRASINFESAFAGVRKTVDATEGEFSALSQSIRQMAKEVPVAATEIAGVAESAGQLGIAKEHIMGFTRTMVDLGVSTNLSGEEAATALARLANITQMNQRDFDRLGSTVVALGNNLATTESEIVEMGLRIAGAGSQIGLTEAQILGFAGALSSVGIAAEAGGSAISRVMIGIANEVAGGGEKLNLFAQVAGMSADEFAAAWEQDAAGALVTFIEGLGEMQKSGENVFGVLDELGLSEIRVRDALLRASGAGDLFRQSIELGSEAWRENTALTEEAAERYKTQESKLKMLANRANEAAISFGEGMAPALLAAMDAAEPIVGAITDMAQGFAELSPGVQKAIVGMGALTAAMGPALWVGGKVRQTFSGLVGAARMLGGMGGTVKGAFGAVTGAAKGLGAAMGAVNVPMLLVVAGIAALVAVGIYLYTHWEEISAWLSATWEGIKETAVAVWTSLGEWLSGLWESIKTGVSEAWESITAFLSGIWEGIQAGWDAFVGGIVAAFQWMYDHNYYFEWLVDTIVAAFEWLRDTATAIWEGITTFLTNTWDAISGTAKAIWASISDFVAGLWNGIKEKASAIFGTIRDVITGIWNRIKTATETAWNTLVGWLSGAYNRVKDAITGPFGAARDYVFGIIDKAKQWGKNLIQGFADGIREKANAVGDAVRGIGEKIWAFLGFHSPTKEGYGREMDEWAPNLVTGFAEGIIRHIPAVEAAMDKLLQPVAMAMTPSVALDMPTGTLRVAAPVSAALTAPPARSGGWSEPSRGAGDATAGTTDRGPVINIENMYVRDDQDIQNISHELYNLHRAKSRARGW